MSIQLFPKDQIAGVFKGFREGGLEFHADLILPYRNDFQNIPMHGQFLLVQLETPDEAVLGRITSFSSEGKLSSGSGEEFNIRAVREDRAIPEDLREQYLKYRVNIRVSRCSTVQRRWRVYVCSITPPASARWKPGSVSVRPGSSGTCGPQPARCSNRPHGARRIRVRGSK